MSCNDLEPLINRYVDAELDPATRVEVEAHLRECWSCAQVSANLQTLKAALRDRSLYAPAPVCLQRRLDALVAHPAVPGAPGTRPWKRLLDILNQPLQLPPLRSRVWPALVAAVFCAVLLGRVISQRLRPDPHVLAEAAEARVEQEVVSSHVRSLLANHLTDVVSSDGPRLQSWFNGKVSFAPAVPHPAGFALLGARLDYLDCQPAAAIVYRRGAHIVNLFVCASPNAADELMQTRTERGYRVSYSVRGGLTYWTVTDLPAAEAFDFANQVEHALPPISPHCA